MNSDSITVHVFSPVVCCPGQPSEIDSDAAKEDATLRSRGRAIAHAGCGTTGWQMPNANDPQDCLLKNAFAYLPAAPPPFPSGAAVPSGNVKEWGTCPSESEKFCIADLNPFESTLFSSLRSCPPVGDPAAPKGSHDRRWSLGSSSPSRPPTKRVKIEVDTGPLDKLIPLPHYVPAPLKSSDPALPCDPPSVHCSFVPIPPQTVSSIEALFSSVYSRVAWLIPVRGRPPWDGVSRASVALGPLSLPESLPGPTGNHPSTSSDSDIVWTHSSLRQFWTFLRSCSETHGFVTGPLSLSFHIAPRPDDQIGSQGGIVSSAACESPYLLANRETEMTPSDPSPLVPIASASKSRTTDIDYVKVYCDAPRAMWVRRTLSQWGYEEDVRAEGPRERGEAIRILEFAKLVLVDERGEGVLVS